MFLLEMSIFAVLFIMLIVGGVVALVVWSAAHQKQIRQNWLSFAQKWNLQMQGGKGVGSRPTIRGWYGRVHIQLNTVVRGSGKNRSTYTQFNATINAPMPQGLSLTKEGFFSKIGKVFGGQDVQVGDPAIDQAFIIKAQDLLGTHELLSNNHVRNALLHTVTRHPGIRIAEKHVLVEQHGMVSKVEKIEAVFGDLAFLVETLDAAYQESAQSKQAELKHTKAPASPLSPGKAAAAEILSAYQEPEPVIRQEDPAERKESLANMANVLNQYAAKMETGEVKPESKDAFATPDVGGDAFATPNLNDDFGVKRTLEDYDPTHSLNDAPASAAEVDVGNMAFDDPKAEDAFASPDLFKEDTPAPADEPKPAAVSGDGLGGSLGDSLNGVMAQLSDSSLMSRDREAIIKQHAGKSWSVEIVVDRIDSSFGFDLPDHLKDGKTVEAHIKGGKTKIAVRFPKDRADEIKKLRHGAELNVTGELVAWDDLFKKPTLDAQ